jgi:hypothetical protein
MSCAERRERLYDRLYGLLEEGDAAELDRHIAGCPDCRREWETLKGRDALLDEWAPEYRPAKPVRFDVKSPRRSGLLWAAAALLVSLSTTILFPSASRYEVLDRGDFAPGARLMTETPASVRLGRAARLELEPGSELLFRRGGPGLDHELELVSGTAHVDVFPTGRAFRVVAGERSVEVRGTRFTLRRFGDDELARILGEDSMKRWNAAPVSVLLLSVTAGTVVLTGPDGPHPVEAGRSVLATPAGVETVEAGESLASVRKVRDELLRSLLSREEKNRAMRAEVDALQGKLRKGRLPPGATLESLMAGLRAALAKGDPGEIQQAISMLSLFLEQDDAVTPGVLKALRETRDLALAQALCSALWGRAAAHRAEILKLMIDSEIPVDIRTAIVQGLQGTFYGNAKVGDAMSALLLRAAKALTGSGAEAVTLRSSLAHLAVQQLSAPSEAWDEFQGFLSAETDDAVRSTVLRTYFWGSSRQKGSVAAEGLLLETLRGRYGVSAQEAQISDPLLPWFSAENADAFAGTLKQAAAQMGEPFRRQAVAGQLGLLYLMQRHAGALEALRQIHAAEPDADTRARLGEVLQAADKGSLDLDKLMEKLQLQWNF